MTEILGIVLLIIVPAVIAGILHIIVNKEKEYLRYGLFYLTYFFVIISGLKTLLHEGEFTLLKSFEENEAATYLHYSVPLLVLVVVTPLFIRILNKYVKDRIMNWDRLLPTSVFSVCALQFMLESKITNAFVASSAGLFIILMIFNLLHLKIVRYDKEPVALSVLKVPVAIFSLWAVTVIYYIPNQLFLANIEEFHFNYLFFARNTIIGTILFILIFSCSTVVFPKLYLNIYMAFVFAVSLCGYVQANFLNGNLTILDGSTQVWSSTQIGGNVVFWVIVIVAMMVLVILYEKKMPKIMMYAATVLVFMQVFAGITLAIMTETPEEEYALTNANLFELNKDKNVIVFILDWYDEQILEKIVAGDEDFLEPLEGFTWYQNQTSRYNYTADSLPYLLTDVEWQKGMTETEYAKYAYENSDFLKDIADQGYDIDVYTEAPFVYNYDEVIDNCIVDSKREIQFLPTITMMTKCSKYQTAPFFMKSKYHYETYEITNLLVNDRTYLGLNSRFYNKLCDERITATKETDGSFRFYHLTGTHDLVFTENCETVEEGETDVVSCGIGVMKIVFEYIKQLKEAGLYDSSTIIITADHGQNYLPDGGWNRDLNDTSNPILLIKKPNEKGIVVTNAAPVSHTDFCASVLNYVGGDGSKYGLCYEDIDENESRIRIMERFVTDKIPYMKYTIDGDAMKLESYSYVTE